MDFLANIFARQQGNGQAGGSPQQTPTGFGVVSADNIDPKSDSHLYQEFNKRLVELLEGLCEAVPESDTLKLALDVHRLLCKTLPGEPMRRWVSSIKDHAHLLLKRTPENEAAFIKVMPTLEYIKELDIVTYWPEFEDSAKDSLWMHLSQLNNLAQTCALFTPSLMGKMESIAESMADDEGGPNIARICDAVMSDVSLLKMVGLNPEQVNDPMVKAMAQQMLGNIKLE